jgi:hypothetical protein
VATQILTNMKVQGQTAAAAAVATLSGVNFNSDGTWDFLDAAGNRIVYSGDNAEVNLLLQLIFVGTGGLPVGTKLFGYA